jgi:hypothetical protein
LTTQSLVITYKGPDTLNGADAAVDDGNAAVPIPGYYQVSLSLSLARSVALPPMSLPFLTSIF